MAEPSFAPFPRLPFEIRRKIWIASVVPRIVHLKKANLTPHKCSRVWSQTSIEGPESMGFFDLDNQSASARREAGPEDLWGFRANSIPSIMLVSKDSNAVAMEMYTLSFGSGHKVPTVWFNFDIDTLYLDWGYHGDPPREDRRVVSPEESFRFFPKDIGDRSKVKNLAIFTPGKLPQEDQWHDRILKDFGNVQCLTLVIPCSPSSCHDSDGAELDFLEHTDVAERQEWCREPGGKYVGHPTFRKLVPWAFSNCSYQPWGSETWLRERYGSNNRVTGARLPQWANLVRLDAKPILNSKQKMALLQEIEKYDEWRAAISINVTLRSEKYAPLEISASLSTSIVDLALEFCHHRDVEMIRAPNGEAGIDVELEDRSYISLQQWKNWKLYDLHANWTKDTSRDVVIKLIFHDKDHEY